MTIELEMLTWVSVLTAVMWVPYVFARVIMYGPVKTITYVADDSPIPHWAARAKKAHLNAIENLVIFASLITVAHLAKVSNDATISAAIAYFWFRLAHYIVYIADIPFGRTVTFLGACVPVFHEGTLVLPVQLPPRPTWRGRRAWSRCRLRIFWRPRAWSRCPSYIFWNPRV